MRPAVLEARARARVLALRRPWLNRLVVPYSRAGNNGWLWVGVGLAVRRPLPVAAVTWGTLASNFAVKHVVARKRPVAEEIESLIKLPVTSSFPSSHAAMSAAAAFVLSETRPRLAPLWVGMAAVMGMSRIYVGAHYASDVAAGFALGTATGAVATVAIRLA